MQTVEIPPARWRPALDEFSAIHEGWLVSVDVLGSEIGAQPEISNLPLVGVSADDPQRGDAIAIAVAPSPRDQFTHVVTGAIRLYVERTDEGADVALGIESDDGIKTIVRFRTPALPETVDGLPHR